MRACHESRAQNCQVLYPKGRLQPKRSPATWPINALMTPYTLSVPWLQVLTVPFYAWSQTGSLPERAAYLDALLSSRSSHLATSQAAGLEPLYCVPGLRMSPALMPRCPPGIPSGHDVSPSCVAIMCRAAQLPLQTKDTPYTSECEDSTSQKGMQATNGWVRAAWHMMDVESHDHVPLQICSLEHGHTCFLAPVHKCCHLPRSLNRQLGIYKSELVLETAAGYNRNVRYVPMIHIMAL